MTKCMLTDLLREIRKSGNRFLSILCIVAIGVAFFSGLRASAPDMAHTVDKYFDDYNMCDIQIISPLGLTDDDISAIKNTDGVENVQAGYITDAVTDFGGMETVLRLHSLPDGYVSNSDSERYINRIELTDGRLPEAANEIIIENQDNMAVPYDVKPGDTVELKPETANGLKITEFTVVGLAKTPLYLTYEMGISQTLNNRKINLFAYIPEDAFEQTSPFIDGETIYTEAVVTVKGARKLNSFDDDYTDIVAQIKSRLENVSVDRGAARAKQLRDYAQRQLDAAKKLYDTKKAEYEKQIVNGKQQLDDAYRKITMGEAELETTEKIYRTKIADAEQDIKYAEKNISDSSQAIKTAEAALKLVESQYQNYHNSNINAMKLLGQFSNSVQQLSDKNSSERRKIQQKEQNPDVTDDQRKIYSDMLAKYDKFDALLRDTQSLHAEMTNDVNQLTDMYNDKITQAKNAVSSAKQRLAQSKKQLSSAKKELAKQKSALSSALSNGQKKLENGRKEYEQGKKEFEKQKVEVFKLLREAEIQLRSAEKQIEQIETASWYVFDRSLNYGYVSYNSTLDSMNAMSKLLPIIFIFVAVLVCMTTMNRMIDEQRGIIGVYKALGYSNAAISCRYIIYVLCAGLLGCLIGFALGTGIFPTAVYSAWSSMYSQPSEIIHTFRPSIFIFSLAFGTGAMGITAYITCRRELVSVPSLLMRPKAPKYGKKILLERIKPLWNLLSFSQKVTMRNIFRYKKRLFMTVIGIFGCSSLLLCGLGMSDTINSIVGNQYGEIFKFNITFTSDSEDSEAYGIISDSDITDGFIRVGYKNAMAQNVKNPRTSDESVSLYVTENPQEFYSFVTLRSRVTGDPLELDSSGIIITEKLANTLGLSAGDNIDITCDGITKRIEIAGVTENYVLHYAYMTQEAYTEAFAYPAELSSVFVKVINSDSDAQYNALTEKLSSLPEVTSLMAIDCIAATYSTQFTSLNQIVMLVILCAAALAFVVLYNLTNVNISERLREIATIKVLGFKNKETALYVYRENLILTLFGALPGLGGGIVMHRFIISQIEQPEVMFGYSIHTLSYLLAILLTCVFAILVMICTYPKLKKISLSESMKSVE
ncbi:MAG: FtsX-like permease family protein [Firmicutes bacterium]|nr:FtsX-like permease family protein [Bacillota bacterium]